MRKRFRVPDRERFRLPALGRQHRPALCSDNRFRSCCIPQSPQAAGVGCLLGPSSLDIESSSKDDENLQSL